MKRLSPLLLALAACKPPPPDLSSITAELAILRQSLDDVRKANQPKLDAVDAMDDLAREVKQLRQKIANPPPPAPPGVPALAVGGPPIKSGELAGGIGGTQPGVNDLYWVLSKVQVNGEDRVVLCLYKAIAGRDAFQLSGVRLLNFDQQIIDYNSAKPSVADIRNLLEKTQKK